MKATSIFGGVQVFQIIITILRTKAVAILIGPTGIGIAGLLSATLGMIGALTSFSLGASAVKDIAAAHSSVDKVRIATVVTVFRRLVWISGLLGSIVTLFFSSWLSQITFGNKEYTSAFMLLSVTLLLNQLSLGQSALLQGMRQIRSMAHAGMIGSILGLITTVPLYYFFGVQGIVPGIIITSIVSFINAKYFARKLKIDPVFVSMEKTKSEGKEMLKFGFIISLTGLITLGSSYILSIFISNVGGVDQVGLYNAGFAIINTYVGMIFTAMATDYYPRLSAVAHSNNQSKNVVNHQAEIAILIISPLILMFIVFINWIVILLYSTKFIPINDMILYAALGMLFKVASWSIGYFLIAKGNSKIIFWSEILINAYTLFFNIIGYKYFGLIGLGFSSLLSFIISFIQNYLTAKIKYEFAFTGVFYKIFLLQFLLALICLWIVITFNAPFSYILGSILIFISFIFSYNELDKRLGLKLIFNSFKNRF